MNTSSARAGSTIQEPSSSSLVELARPPTGVAGEDARTPQLAELVGIDLRGEEPDRVEDQRSGAVGLDEVGEHDDRRGLHRAAEVNLLDPVDEHRELGHRLADRRLRRPG